MRESLETLFTFERFFSSVKSDVLGQVMLVLELLVAPIAEPGTLICKLQLRSYFELQLQTLLAVVIGLFGCF